MTFLRDFQWEEMAKKQSYSMLSTNPESRDRPDPGMSSTGAFVTPLGPDRAVGGLQKFRIGKVIGNMLVLRKISFTKVALVLLNIPYKSCCSQILVGDPHAVFRGSDA